MKYRLNQKEQEKRIAAALGTEKAELVLKNGRVLNVFTNELEKADVAVSGKYIVGIGSYKGEKEIDLQGHVVCPGFIDGHIHLESSMISPLEFAKTVVPHGTVAVVTDPHEIANVAGTLGIDYILEATETLPMDVFVMLPSCVPATRLDEAGDELNADKLEPYYKHERVLGLAELMNAYGTVRGEKEILRKTAGAFSNKKIIDGHAPGLSGKELNAYCVAGVASDHECCTTREALEKIKRGQWIMIREGTAAKNLKALLPLFSRHYYGRCMLVSDDKHTVELSQSGHIDAIIRQAVSYGANPIHAVKMASLHPAEYFGLKDIGAVAPGYLASFVIVDSLEKFQIQSVYREGLLVAKDGVICEDVLSDYSGQLREEVRERVCHSFHIKELVPQDLRNELFGKFKRVIGLIPGELLTKELIVPNWTSGVNFTGILSQGVELERDIVKLMVAERHKQTGHIGIGFVYGYGLRKGAIASSIAHDSHNLIAIGVSDEDLCVAANRVRNNQGGIVIVSEGKVLSEIALPIAGLMCEETAEITVERLERLKKLAYSMGVFTCPPRCLKAFV